VASSYFHPENGSRQGRAEYGLALTKYAALLPGHLLVHSGQELQEDASVFGPFAGDNGKSSIFDFVYQSQSKKFHDGRSSSQTLAFRQKYVDLFKLMHKPAFAAAHSPSSPSIMPLPSSFFGEHSKSVNGYIRFHQDQRYLVVTNMDPVNEKKVTVHFTSANGEDSDGALAVLRATNDSDRLMFVELTDRQGWVPVDPAVSGKGHPGRILFRASGIPSGLYLGRMPSGTTYVFKIVELN
jgi:hypothetical protein